MRRPRRVWFTQVVGAGTVCGFSLIFRPGRVRGGNMARNGLYMDAVWTSGKEGDEEGGTSRADSAQIVYELAMSSTWCGRGLPCRKIFKLSTIVTAVEASKWTSSRFYGDSKNLFRFVFKAIAKRDVFFAGYSAQDSSNVGYVPYGDRFYKPIVDFVVAGFRQPRDVNTLTSLHCAVRESMTNLLDRFRKKYKEKMETTAKEVAGSLKDHLFRLSLVEDSSYHELLDLTDTSPAHAEFTCLK